MGEKLSHFGVLNWEKDSRDFGDFKLFGKKIKNAKKISRKLQALNYYKKKKII